MNKLEIKKELELMILSAMLNKPDSVPAIAQKIKPEDLSKENEPLFSKILSLTSNDKAMRILDLAKVPGWDLVSLNELDSGCSYESLIYNQVFERFYDINFSLKVDSFLMQAVKNNEDNIEGLDTLSSLQTEIDQLIKTTSNFFEDKKFSDRLDEIYSKIEDELSSKNISSYTLRNIPSFNTATGGIRPSNLIGIAGSFKSGKTTLGLNLMVDFAKQKIPAGIFSLELSQDEFDRKVLGMLSGVSYETLREPKKLSEADSKKLTLYKREVKELPLYCSDKPMSEIELRQKAKYWKDRFGVKIIAIDYIGYIRSKRRFETREREMSYYSEFLKSLAKELNICVIALAQLNRTGKLKPSTENLAESIALARDCDFLFITYNPFELGIKNNNGFTFTESHFFVKLDTTRHTKFKKQFLLNLNNDGNFVEVATEYSNDYQKENYSNNKFSFQESESVF